MTEFFEEDEDVEVIREAWEAAEKGYTAPPKWWSVSITFQATFEEADQIFGSLVDVACGGEGEGEDHVCQRDIIGSLRPEDDIDSECVQVQSRFVDRFRRLLKRRG